MINKILRLKSIGKVLDVGCGGGEDSVLLAKNGLEVTGIDVRQEAIHNSHMLAKIKKVNVNFIHQDIFKYKTKKKFDIILCLGMLHFLDLKNSRKAIKKIQKLTSKGGINYIEFADNGLEKEIKSQYKSWKVLIFKIKSLYGKHRVTLVAKK